MDPLFNKSRVFYTISQLGEILLTGNISLSITEYCFHINTYIIGVDDGPRIQLTAAKKQLGLTFKEGI